MKIGVLAQYLDTRSDVRDLLALLAKNNDLTVYLKFSDYERTAPLLPSGTLAVALPRLSLLPNLISIAWQYTYLIFGVIPRSRYNYYMVERIRLGNKGIGRMAMFIQKSLLMLSRYVPNFISYDNYLAGLALFPAPIALPTDIDLFFCNTQIYDDRLYAHILRQGAEVWTYVYSWDHPCKMKTFSRRTRYLVWHEGIKTDLIELQGLSADCIALWGATQFSYIKDFMLIGNSLKTPYPFPYLYFGFATGYDELVAQEVRYVAVIAHQMAELLPEYKLVVRPYPFQANWELYDPLRALDNVVFDDGFRAPDGSMAVGREGIEEKLEKLRHARAFLHFGTTMGYEACYFEVPSCLMAFVDPQRDALLHGFVHQYQNDKYLHDTAFPNVVSSVEALRRLLSMIGNDPASLLAYNHQIRRLTPLQSLPEMTDALTNQFQTPYFPKP